MHGGIIATLVGHRRCPSQCLHTGSIAIAMTIVSPFCQYARSQPFACSRKTAEDLVVFMGQKKVLCISLS